MVLISCPECKKQISETAESCPECGYALTPEEIETIKEKEKAKKHMQLQIGCGVPALIVAIVTLLVVISPMFKKPSTWQKRIDNQTTTYPRSYSSPLPQVSQSRITLQGTTPG